MNFIEKVASIKPKADFLNHTYISLRHRYIYTAVGKAANSTVKHHLYDLEYTGTRFKTKSLHDRQSSPLLSPFQLPDDLMEEVFTSSRYFRFTIVRNPFTRLLSCYLDRIIPKESAPYKQLARAMNVPLGTDIGFPDFIDTICKQKPYEQNNHWRLQTSEICLSSINYDFIGKQENFAKDMVTIWSQIGVGVKRPDFKKENKSPSITGAGKKLNEFYTPELVEQVIDAYREDFITFNYSTVLQQ